MVGKVGRCRLTLGRLWGDCAWVSTLKPKYDEPLSDFAFDFNLRCYAMEGKGAGANVKARAGGERRARWGGAFCPKP